MTMPPEIKESCKSQVVNRLERRLKDLKKLLRAYQGKCDVPCEECKPCLKRGEGNRSDEYETARRETDQCEDPTSESELIDYALSFNYVTPGTFRDYDAGYFRYQISWGGPSDEFRFYCGPEVGVVGWICQPYSIEYWFMDWGDGAKVTLTGEDHRFVMELWGSFLECKVESVLPEREES